MAKSLSSDQAPDYEPIGNVSLYFNDFWYFVAMTAEYQKV